MRLFTSTSPLLKLVRRGKWDAVEEMLFAESSSSIRSSSPCFLHQLLKHNPPVEIVDLALHKLQNDDVIVEEERDDKGRTPLHIAALYSCDARMVKLLLDGVSGVMPALTNDKQGNTPLHSACSVNFDSFRRHNIKKALALMSNATEIVTRLLQANPEAATVRNKRGELPLQLAQENNADARMIYRIEIAQQTFMEGGKVSSETFKTTCPLSSNEFSIVSRDGFDASFSSVGFDDDISESSLLDLAEVMLSTVREEEDGNCERPASAELTLLSI